jgi:hypothetical protein
MLKLNQETNSWFAEDGTNVPKNDGTELTM